MEVRQMWKKTRLWARSHAGTIWMPLMLGVILVFFNLFFYFNFFRLDLTRNGQYTLSPVSKRIARHLDDIISIKVYFSKKLPPTMANHAQQVYDVLKEYKAYGRGNIRIEYIDPAKDDMLRYEVQRLGIPEVRMDVLQKDQRQIMAGYLGIAIYYGEKHEVLPVVKDVSGLEYKITSALKKLTTSAGRTKIGFLKTLKGKDLYTDYRTLSESLADQYDVSEIEIQKNERMIRENIRTLIVAGPAEVPLNARMAIDQFIRSGGRALFLLDRVKVGQQLNAQPVNEGLDEILTNYGIRLNPDLVCDRSCDYVGFNAGQYTYSMPYPFSVKALNRYFDKVNPSVKDLQSLSFQFISSISTEPRPNITFSTLVRTTEYSWNQTGLFNLNPQMVVVPKIKSEMHQNNLIVLASGKFVGPYPASQASTNSYVIVAGDSDFASDNMARNSQEDLMLAVNMVDWLSLDDGLIHIRSKQSSDSVLGSIPDAARSILKYFNIIGVALVIIIWGLVRFTVRRRQRKTYYGN
jgi:ABC-2 type transport system permease protein